MTTQESHARTALKTLSWRAIAAVVTGTLGYLATGSLEAGLALGSADTVIKLGLYYGHERLWARVPIGYVVPGLDASLRASPDSPRRPC